jgi:Holliday junction resolvase-like predicted endonuclease
MTTRYTRGRDSEYRAQRDLEAEGYTTFRTAGSHGEADIIALNDKEIRLIQIKTYQKRATGYGDDIAHLADLVTPPNASRELWIRKVGQRGWQDRIRIDTPEDPA